MTSKAKEILEKAKKDLDNTVFPEGTPEYLKKSMVILNKFELNDLLDSLERLEEYDNSSNCYEVAECYNGVRFIKCPLEQELDKVKKENQELKARCKAIPPLVIQNEKLTKAIEWLKENLNFKIEKHKSSPNCMFVSYKDLQEWLEPSNEIVDLLKEVLGE